MFASVRAKLRLFLVTLLVLLFLTPVILAGEKESERPIDDFGESAKGWEPATQSLHVMSFNMAHGRSDGPNQMLVSAETIHTNLEAINTMLKREQPDIVALQEADQNSFWNGFYDHVGYVAQGAGMRYATHATNIDAPMLAYGTAVLSQHPIQEALGVTFDRNSPIPKGFVVSTIAWPATDGMLVDIVSVHLDFSSGWVQAGQMAELAAILAERQRPTIVLGDFNFNLGDSPERWVPLQELGLTAYEVNSAEFVTNPTFNSRIDWVLISPEFKFDSYTVLPDVLSDHLIVSAEISLR